MHARDFFPTSRGFRETLTVHPVGCQCAEWCAPVAEPSWAAPFWSSVERSDVGCWIWRGRLNDSGYGVMRVAGNRSPQRAHRLSWTLANGEIPAGMQVCHHCDVPRCVRPDHLFLGTAQDNADDMKRKGRSAKGVKNGVHTRPDRRARGLRVPGAKITDDLAREVVRLRRDEHWSYGRIARHLSVSRSIVLRVCREGGWQQATGLTGPVSMPADYDYAQHLRGDAAPRAKLCSADVLAIFSSLEPRADLAARYGVSVGYVQQIQLGRTWRHLLRDRQRPTRARASCRGEQNPRARLTESNVHEIRSRLATGETCAALARAFEVSPSLIRAIRDRVSWRHLADDTAPCPLTGHLVSECLCRHCDEVTDARDQGDYEVEHQCECCGALSCEDCEIDTIEWTDPESGYWAERGCLTHRCGVSS